MEREIKFALERLEIWLEQNGLVVDPRRRRLIHLPFY